MCASVCATTKIFETIQRTWISSVSSVVVVFDCVKSFIRYSTFKFRCCFQFYRVLLQSRWDLHRSWKELHLQGFFQTHFLTSPDADKVSYYRQREAVSRYM